MKCKLVVSMLAIAFTMSFLLSSVTPAFASPTDGPRMDYLICDISYDVTTEWLKLKGGSIDFMDWDITKAMIDEAPSNVVMDPIVAIGMREFDLNCQRWPTDDVRFRRAIAYLVNKPSIILDVLQGYGGRMDTVIPPGALAPYLNTEVSYPTYPYEYNPTIAQQILTDAGYLPWNPAWPKLLFWARLDDPQRTAAAAMLKDELVKLGIGVDYRPADRSVTYPEVMVNFNYNIYTGGWGLSRDVDYVHDLWSSEFYRPAWYNYEGFVNATFDAEADRLKYAPDAATVMDAVKKCQKIMVEQMPTIPLWSATSKMAYRKGMENVVNFEGAGPDNGYSFFDTYYSPDLTKKNIVYGFKSDIEGLNIITAEWTWDYQALGLIYDTMLSADPYNLPIDYNKTMTKWYSVGSWVDPSDGETKTSLKFHLLPEGTIKWHPYNPLHPTKANQLLSNPDVTVHDIKFTIDYNIEQEGWAYSSVMDVKYALTHAEANQPGAPAPTDTDEIWVYMNVLSFWALHWIGSALPIIPEEIWSQVPDAYAYDPIAAGTVVGCGPWKFVERVVGQYIKLENINHYGIPYYWTAESVHETMQEAFHRSGDVDNNREIRTMDYASVGRLFKATPYSPVPNYLPPAGSTDARDGVGYLPLTRSWRISQGFKPEDLNYDGKVYTYDLATIGKNWGKKAG